MNIAGKRIPHEVVYGVGVLVLAVVVYHLFVRPARSTRQTVAGSAEGLSPDVAAALSGQPSVNAAPADQLGGRVLDDLGHVWSAFDTTGTRLAAAAAASPVFRTVQVRGAGP